MYDTSDLGYVENRLRGTVVRDTQGKAILINRIDTVKNKKIYFYARRLVNPSNDWESVSIDTLDLSSPPLGYTNYQDKCRFVTRVALRNDWRQGLRLTNITTIEQSQTRRPEFKIESLVGPIECVYPTYQECVDRVEDIFQAQAWSREFCIDERGGITFKGRFVVGEDRGGTPTLNPKFFWLTELLQKSVEHGGDNT
jgi:hypothetical protein